MRNIMFFYVILIFFNLAAWAGPKEYLYWRQTIEQDRFWRSEINVPLRDFASGTTAGVIMQRLDHNSQKDVRTFSQRYWVNSVFAKTDDAPVLFYVCGEGACGEYAVRGQVELHAQRLEAHVVALEHRYYGKSQPYKDLRTANLRYLTVFQALSDLVSFHEYMKINAKRTGPWILVGGSYPGALAAYARALYPDHFAGALASSAPVQADIDFSEYDRHVALMAGEECLTAVQNVVSEIEKSIQTSDGFESTKEEFYAVPLRDRDDFLYLIADTGAAAVQYGMREDFCNLVMRDGRAGYARAAQMVGRLFGNLVDMSAQAAEDISLEKHTSGVGMRQWLYQSCTEFGFWQNAWPNPAESARSSRINADYHSRICNRLFGIKTSAQVDETNVQFYDPILDKTTTNILFTNGSEDPWMNLSITDGNKNTLNPNIESYVIPQAAHCADLRVRGTPDVIKAKEFFITLAFDWLDSK